VNTRASLNAMTTRVPPPARNAINIFQPIA
jgi:hypothetical protein